MKKKLSPAKKRIIENYERQRTEFIERGYQEKSEVISIVQANGSERKMEEYVHRSDVGITDTLLPL